MYRSWHVLSCIDEIVLAILNNSDEARNDPVSSLAFHAFSLLRDAPADSSRNFCLNGTLFFENLETVPWKPFVVRRHQDATEYMFGILDRLTSIHLFSHLDDLLRLRVMISSRCDRCLTINPSVVSQLNVYMTLPDEIDLTDQNQVSLVQSLITSFKTTLIKKCNQCEVDTEHRVVPSRPVSLPPYLLFLIKRYSSQPNARFVRNPSLVDVVPSFLVRASGQAAPTKYSLVAGISHKGTLHSGHYYAHIRRGDQGSTKWFTCDDSIVSDSTWDNDVKPDLQKNCYLLLYKQ